MQPPSTAGSPSAAILIDTHVVTVTPDLIFIGFSGAAPTPEGLVQTPAFSVVLSIANAHALAQSLQEAIRATDVLAVDESNPQ